MHRFSYERPTSVAETVRLLADGSKKVQVLAGGTDLVVGLRDDSFAPDVVVDLKRVEEFSGPSIALEDDRLVFNATAVMSEIEVDARVLAQLPALAEAARVVGSVQIRNRASLVGNICNGSPAADTAPPLLVYGATVVVSDIAGVRRVPIEDFIVGPGSVDLMAGELVTAIEVPLPSAGSGSAYTRLVRRRGTDLASVTMCASVDDADRVALAYGSVGPRAVLVSDESGELIDTRVDAVVREARLAELLSGASPSKTSIRAGPDYRLAMLPVLAGRAVRAALARRDRSAA